MSGRKRVRWKKERINHTADEFTQNSLLVVVGDNRWMYSAVGGEWERRCIPLDSRIWSRGTRGDPGLDGVEEAEEREKEGKRGVC